MTLRRPLAALAAAAATALLALILGAPALAQTTLKMNISLAQNSSYGVAIDAGTWTVDEAATAVLRAERRRK